MDGEHDNWLGPGLGVHLGCHPSLSCFSKPCSATLQSPSARQALCYPAITTDPGKAVCCGWGSHTQGSWEGWEGQGGGGCHGRVSSVVVFRAVGRHHLCGRDVTCCISKA